MTSQAKALMPTLQEQIAAIRLGGQPPQKLSALVKLTNGVPWELCCMIRVWLANPGRELDQLGDEMGRWLDAGAVPTGDEARLQWLKERRHPERPCDQCRGTKGELNPGRLFTLTSKGFGYHILCHWCYQGYTLAQHPWVRAAGCKLEVAQ